MPSLVCFLLCSDCYVITSPHCAWICACPSLLASWLDYCPLLIKRSSFAARHQRGFLQPAHHPPPRVEPHSRGPPGALPPPRPRQHPGRRALSRPPAAPGALPGEAARKPADCHPHRCECGCRGQRGCASRRGGALRGGGIPRAVLAAGEKCATAPR